MYIKPKPVFSVVVKKNCFDQLNNKITTILIYKLTNIKSYKFWWSIVNLSLPKIASNIKNMMYLYIYI